MNFKEILDEMKRLGISKQMFSGVEFDDYEGDHDDDDADGESAEQIDESLIKKLSEDNKEITIEGLGKIVIVEQEGGYAELQDGAYGMEWHIVRHFVDHNVYIKLAGYYSSYDGLEIQGNLCEVHAVPKTVIVYE